MRAQIDRDGIRALARDRRLDEQVSFYADQVLDRAKRGARAHYASGRYLRTLKSTRGRTASIVYFVGSDAFTAGFVEWGMGSLNATNNLLKAAQKAGLTLRAVKYTH